MSVRNPGGILGSTSTPSSLMRGLQSNDEAAWGRFMLSYGENLRKWLEQKLKGRLRADIDDIVNEVCLRVFQQWPKAEYGPKGTTFRGWLARTTKNKMVDVLKAHKLMPAHLSAIDSDFDIEEIVNSNDHEWKYDPTCEQIILEAEAYVRARVKDEEWDCYVRVVHLHQQILDVEAETGIPKSTVSARKQRVFELVRAKARELADLD